MSNLIDIQSQIEKLQKQANELKAKDFTATVKEIQAKMQAYGITVKDLQAPKSGKAGRPAKGVTGLAKPAKVSTTAKAPKAARKAGIPVAAKFRGPNGESWSGRGLTHKWLTSLVAQGHTKESFAVAVAAEPAPAPASALVSAEAG
jgi:DNA-binding protein H-NS